MLINFASLFHRFDNLTDIKTGRMCAYACVLVQACVCLNAYACICTSVRTSAHMCLYFARECGRLRVGVCVCVSVCAFANVRACMRGRCAWMHVRERVGA